MNHTSNAKSALLTRANINYSKISTDEISAQSELPSAMIATVMVAEFYVQGLVSYLKIKNMTKNRHLFHLFFMMRYLLVIFMDHVLL